MSDGSGASGAPPDSVRLVVQEGLEAYLPLADLMDADKERARLGKQAKTPPSNPSPSPSPNSNPGLWARRPRRCRRASRSSRSGSTGRASRTRRRPPSSPRRRASSTSSGRLWRQSTSRSTSCRARERRWRRCACPLSVSPRPRRPRPTRCNTRKRTASRPYQGICNVNSKWPRREVRLRRGMCQASATTKSPKSNS